MIVIDQIEAFDARITRVHQRVADWIFNEWDITPYQIAAQLFAAISLVHILFVGVAISTESEIRYIFLLTGLFYSASSFIRSTIKQASWKRTKLVPPPFPFDILLRIGWMYLLVWVALAAFLHLSPNTALHLLLCVVTIEANYFFVCHPPRFTGRRRKLPIGKTVFAKG